MSRPRSELLALLALCLLAAALRFATLSVQSFDFDESFSVGIVLNGSLGHALSTLPRTESTPPLWYVLAWLWTRVFGLSAFGIRSLSALAGVGLVPVAWAAARRLAAGRAGQRAGLIAAGLVAVNPLLVWYSQEARSYSLLALLSGLSLLALLRALDERTGRSIAWWVAASAAALLTHYFAVFLIAGEAAWLLVAVRRRAVWVACGVIAAVGIALVPLLVSQADNRTQWIERLSLSSRVREVAKKWLTGEISPTHNWQLALAAVLIGVPAFLAVRTLEEPTRTGFLRVLSLGAAALLLPLILDLGGLHYLISKNVMPALVVLLIAAAVGLSGARARVAGLAAAALTGAFFLALTIDEAISPATQRPDYRAAVSAIGPPARDQVLVTPNLGWPPVQLYRPGASFMPAGYLARQVLIIFPLPRADESHRRPATPSPPPGFTLEGRRDAHTYTLICFGSPVPRPLQTLRLIALAGTTGASAQVWPAARQPSAGNACAGAHR